MLRAFLFAVVFVSVTASCGSVPPFRIDDVTITPEEILLNTLAEEDLRISAAVTHERQEVTRVWVTSDEGPIWIELEKKVYPRWVGTIPLASFGGFNLGEYLLDVHATDLSGREITLEDAVRFRIVQN